MSPIRCFLVAESGRVRIYLRRYASVKGDEQQKCPVHRYHDASVIIDVRDAVTDARGFLECIPSIPRDDPRWAAECDCGYVFQPDDEWQTGQEMLYAVQPGSEAPAPGPWTNRELPPGAMFYPSWLQPEPDYVPTGNGYTCPTNGSVLCVITPNNPDGTGRHDWIIDAYCSNCDRKGQPHHCWCRYGDAPNVTVNKVPPDSFGTCSAGAGSIWTRMPEGWHGFLQNGHLTQA